MCEHQPAGRGGMPVCPGEGFLQAPPARCGPPCFVSVVRERGAWSHEFIFVHAFLIKRKSECLWFNSFGASIEFFFSGAPQVGSVPTYLP